MLEIKNVSVKYENTGAFAVDDVTFSLERGECAALIGANGAGKTSLLLSLVGINELYSGAIVTDHIEQSKKTMRELRKKTGLVFQNPDEQLFMPNVYEDCAFGLRNLGKSEAEIPPLIEKTLSSLGISHLAKRSPLKLSGGEKRLSAIAAVLCMEPDYLILDEPTAFLDPRAVRELAGILASLPQGKLIATHNMDFAENTCTRAIILSKGKIAADGDISIIHNEALLESAGL